MKISPFTPLFFDVASPSDGVPSRYIQVWAPYDEILIEVVASAGETAPEAAVLDAHSGSVFDAIEWSAWEMNSGKTLYFHTLRGMSPGHYKVRIGDLTSEEFRVTTDAYLLGNTMLLQYRFKDNRQRDDVVSVIDHVPYFFDWRIPGGFKDSGWQFGVSNEQFTTQREDVVELFATDYVIKTLTLGGPEGVPVWYGEMLNRLLTCSYVYIGGERYTRNESETPAMTTLVDGLDSFVFAQSLRKAQLLAPQLEEENRTALRRIDSTYYRIGASSNNVSTTRAIY